MKKIYYLFTDHPHSVGETYIEHFMVALRLSFKLGLASMMQCIHAICPFFMPRLGTDVLSLRKTLEECDPELRRRRHETGAIGGTD
jgi:hypothetical protein